MLKPKKLFVLCMMIAVVIVLSGGVFAEDGQKININTASVEELAQLKRVGTKYAERIVEYRKTNGPFVNPEDIMNVPGIGQKIWEENKDHIVVK
ncbi:MAG TPA: helix-hairpin-helix domain-containing protein [Desulfobacterales bacterium]|nr:helix-hairpin-helix domain-containing protein [Desulfobacterales bacterium]